jgi:DNA-directed RNA polymerase subunit RPC12/RpoP
MQYKCVSCGKELDCSISGECYSDNYNAFTHSHLGGIYCKECYSKIHPFCKGCDKPLSQEWNYCPWCGDIK